MGNIIELRDGDKSVIATLNQQGGEGVFCVMRDLSKYRRATR